MKEHVVRKAYEFDSAVDVLDDMMSVLGFTIQYRPPIHSVIRKDSYEHVPNISAVKQAALLSVAASGHAAGERLFTAYSYADCLRWVIDNYVAPALSFYQNADTGTPVERVK